MNVEIRQILYTILIFTLPVGPSKQHTLDSGRKPSENQLEPPRYSQVQKYGTVADVEPSPNIRIYLYNPPDSFNPTSKMFSRRMLREMETERFKDQANKIDGEFSKIKESQKRQLAMIIDSIERSSRER